MNVRIVGLRGNKLLGGRRVSGLGAAGRRTPCGGGAGGAGWRILLGGRAGVRAGGAPGAGPRQSARATPRPSRPNGTPARCIPRSCRGSRASAPSADGARARQRREKRPDDDGQGRRGRRRQATGRHADGARARLARAGRDVDRASSTRTISWAWRRGSAHCSSEGDARSVGDDPADLRCRRRRWTRRRSRSRFRFEHATARGRARARLAQIAADAAPAPGRAVERGALLRDRALRARGLARLARRFTQRSWRSAESSTRGTAPGWSTSARAPSSFSRASTRANG